MKKYLLGIDIGSGSCKLCLLDKRGLVVGSAAQEYSPLTPNPGWAEQNPEDWFDAAIATLKTLSRSTGIDPGEICAVACTGQMKGATFIGADGQAVRPSILWNDLRTIAEVEELKTRYAETIESISLNPFNTTCTLPRAVWLQKHEPQAWEQTEKIIFPKDFITYKLTGRVLTDLTEASAVCFFDPRAQSWRTGDVYDRLAFPREKLPEIIPSTEVAGKVTPTAAARTGLPVGIPVVAGGSDATVESLAVGQVHTGQCKIRLGTAGALVSLVESLDDIDQGRYYVWSYLFPGIWMLDNNTRACAQSTTWFRQVFLKSYETSEEAYRIMISEAEDVPIGCEGLFFHPYLMGEDSPYWNPRLTGSFFGIRATHHRAHFARAVLEGTAYALRDARSAFDNLKEPTTEYLMVGGGIKNPLWSSIIADVLGIEAYIPEQADAAFGAAMIAGIGSGVFPTLQDAINRCVRFEHTVSFSDERQKKYSQLFERYRRLKRVFDAAYEESGASS